MGSAAWQVLTVASLYPVMVPEQIRIVIEKNASYDPDDDPINGFPFTSAMHMVANEVRTAIVSNPRNTLSLTAYSVPPELVRTTAYLILDQLRGYFSLAAGVTEAQENNIKDAKEMLKQLRERDPNKPQFIISNPSDPETDPAQQVQPQAATVYTSEGDYRLATRESLSGII